MAFKFVAFATLLAIAQAGIINQAYPSKVVYSEAPAVSYSSLSAPLAPAKLTYSQASSVSYSSLSAPVPTYTKVAAPLPPQTHSHVPAPVSYASTVTYAAPAIKTIIIAEPSAPAHYDFGYAVNDPQTGDSKSQQESRRGDVVQGSYSLVDADGTKRIVEYTADDHNGFNAIVRKESAGVAVKTVTKVASAAYAQQAPVVYAQPGLKVAGPIGYSVPSIGYTRGQYYH